jgi:hypothetical protein
MFNQFEAGKGLPLGDLSAAGEQQGWMKAFAW